MTRAELVELVARGICARFRMNPDNFPGWKQFELHAEGAVAALSRAGLAVAPVRPTEEMSMAGVLSLSEQMEYLWTGPKPCCRFPPPFHSRSSNGIFKAMLAAGAVKLEET